MAYTSLVTSSITLEDSSVGTTNLSNSIFIATHAFTQNRVTSFSSWSEVKEVIPSTSTIYTALRTAFKQDNVPAPVYLGRRQVDSMTLTASTVTDSYEYTFSITVYNTDDYDDAVTTEVSVDSDTSATAAEIATAIYSALVSVDNLNVTDNTGSVTIESDAGYDFYVEDLTSKLTASYETSETAADVLTAVLEEGENDWYFVTAEDHTEDFVLAMAEEVEATDSDEYPKMYMVCVADDSYKANQTDPATTILGMLAENAYDRTAGIWNQDADSTFPELAVSTYIGYYDAGTIGWKGLTNLNGVDVVANPNTSVSLSTSYQGYIADHNASWWAKERGTAFEHGGMVASGEWGDVIRAMDWLNSEIKSELMDMWLDEAAGGKLSFTTSDLQKPLNVITDVLNTAVDREILTSYDGPSLPSTISSTDQIDRILDDITWTGYLAGAVYSMTVNGTLTYEDEEIE